MTNRKTGIPDKVRGVAAEKGWTQDRVAASIGISRTQLVQRYAGRTSFRADELLTLAHDMRVPIARFFPTEAELESDAADALPTPAALPVPA